MPIRPRPCSRWSAEWGPSSNIRERPMEGRRGNGSTGKGEHRVVVLRPSEKQSRGRNNQAAGPARRATPGTPEAEMTVGMSRYRACPQAQLKNPPLGTRPLMGVLGPSPALMQEGPPQALESRNRRMRPMTRGPASQERPRQPALRPTSGGESRDDLDYRGPEPRPMLRPAKQESAYDNEHFRNWPDNEAP